MKKVNRTNILKILLVLTLVAGVGASVAAIGRFTPTHAISEPVYCGACHPDQVVELNATTHLPHFASAIYEQAEARLAGNAEAEMTKAEAVSGGCMMCHNTWDNREKFYVTGYSLTPQTGQAGTTEYILKWNDVVTSNTNKSARYNIAVSNSKVDQSVTLADKLLDANLGVSYGNVVVSDSGSGIILVGTVIAKTGNYTVSSSTGKAKFLSSSATMAQLATDGAKVDIGPYNGSWINKLVKLPAADGQYFALGANPTNVVIVTNNSIASGIPNGTTLLVPDNYTVVGTGVILNGSSSTIKLLSGNASTIDISATVTKLAQSVSVGMARVRVGTNVSNIKIVVQNPGTSGLVAGDVLDLGTDYTTSLGTTPYDSSVTYVTFSGTSARSVAMSAGSGSVKITYAVAGTVKSLKEMWGEMSALSPSMVGVFVKDKELVPSWSSDLGDYKSASCGNPEKGFCHSVETAVGISAANMMQENNLNTGASGNGVYFQHEMAYTSAQYAAKQVKLCGACHVNKLPPMKPDGTPMRIEATDVPQVNYHGTFVTDTSIVSSDWAHRQVQCIRCHGHAGIGEGDEALTGVRSS